MRALILLVSAFLTAFAGTGAGARAVETSQVVAAASAIAAESREIVVTHDPNSARFSLMQFVWIDLARPTQPHFQVRIFANRLRI